MLIIQVILLIVLMQKVSLLEEIYYVKPTSSSWCPPGVQSCLTLQQYAEKQSNYFKTGSTFLFLAGDHSTDKILLIKNVSNITLKGLEIGSSTSKINLALQCEKVSNLTIRSLTLTFSGHVEEIMSGLTINNRKLISLTNIIFQGNTDIFSGH